MFNKKLISAAIISATLSTSALASSATELDRSKLNDAWLDGKAETTLLLNTNLNSFAIDTEVKDGVVTLSGSVNNRIDSNLAEELVIGLDGVKSVDNNITVSGKNTEDEKITSQLTSAKIASVVKSKLLLNRNIPGTAIDVDVDNGTVTLKGKVDNDKQRDLAVAIAKNTNDVNKVVNKLTITSS